MYLCLHLHYLCNCLLFFNAHTGSEQTNKQKERTNMAKQVSQFQILTTPTISMILGSSGCSFLFDQTAEKASQEIFYDTLHNLCLHRMVPNELTILFIRHDNVGVKYYQEKEGQADESPNAERNRPQIYYEMVTTYSPINKFTIYHIHCNLLLLQVKFSSTRTTGGA